ncbi:MAG: hypothetical protein IKA71_08955, partial [Lentisphaeria bacterium]|nr:hypothetical protein [Lentisphaeria bacterium]
GKEVFPLSQTLSPFQEKRGTFAPVCRKNRQSFQVKQQRNTYLTSFAHKQFDQSKVSFTHHDFT